jgi:hypothetical protein
MAKKHNNDGKKNLIELTSKFYESVRGSERNDKRVTLSDLGTNASSNFDEEKHIENLEKSINEISKQFNFNNFNAEQQSMFVERVISIKSTLSPKHYFDIITDILGVKNYSDFYKTLHRGAREFFTKGLNNSNE